jgi:hypothetical protein
VLTVIGWTTGLEALASVRSKYIPMAPSTALGFSLLGAVLFARASARPGLQYLAGGCATAVVVLALAKIAEFSSPVSFGLMSARGRSRYVRQCAEGPDVADYRRTFLISASERFACSAPRFALWGLG